MFVQQRVYKNRCAVCKAHLHESAVHGAKYMCKRQELTVHSAGFMFKLLCAVANQSSHMSWSFREFKFMRRSGHSSQKRQLDIAHQNIRPPDHVLNVTCS